MFLYLVRHGDAVAEIVDPQRPLSQEGASDIKQVAIFLKKINMRVKEILHSNKKRAEQTAIIIKDTLNLLCPLTALSYLSPEDRLDEILRDIITRTVTRPGNLLVVGHLPFLDKLVSKLVTGDENKNLVNFKTGTVVALEEGSESSWQIAWCINPEQVREVGFLS